jgi:hypothetical protein
MPVLAAHSAESGEVRRMNLIPQVECHLPTIHVDAKRLNQIAGIESEYGAGVYSR